MITKPNALTRRDPIILFYAQLDLIRFIKENSLSPGNTLAGIPAGLNASELLALTDEVARALIARAEQDK